MSEGRAVIHIFSSNPQQTCFHSRPFYISNFFVAPYFWSEPTNQTVPQNPECLKSLQNCWLFECMRGMPLPTIGVFEFVSNTNDYMRCKILLIV